MDSQKAVLKIVKKMGSMAELARQLGVSRGSVNDWVKGRRKIPARLVKKIVNLSDGELTEEDLRPDVFYN